MPMVGEQDRNQQSNKNDIRDEEVGNRRVGVLVGV